MKKLILLFLPFVSIFLHAEELKFVTVLSSPVGSFNKLEAVDYETTVTSPVINFCTSIGNEGTITLRGKNNPSMEHLNLSANTVLSGNGSNYVLNKITMNHGGTLNGSRLLANTVQINKPTAGKSDHLYTNELVVSGAKTKTLRVNGTDSYYIENPLTTNPEMVWSNEYQDDDACKSGSACAKQYLLKEKGNRIPETPKCTADRRTKWDGTRCVCPNDGEYWVNGFCCSVDTPKTNRQCWIPPRTAWIVPAGFDHTSVSGNANCNVSGLTICPGVQMQYNNDPNNTYWVLPSNSDIADGKTCSPTRQCIYDCVIRRKSEIVGWSYTADIKIAACAERAYTPQWDPAVHKNY